MTEAQEVRARAKALRERREELEKALAGAAGPGARPLRLELARVKEELVDCARRPSHKVRCRTTWAGVDGWQWDRFQYQTWAELEGAGEQDGPTELDRMRLAVRLARERAVTDKQGEYLAQVEGGKKAAQVAREAGRHRGTVSRTVGRGRTKIAKEAKALYEVLQAQQGPGPLVVDLADGRVLEAVLSLLTPRQQLYLYLYYGEWLSLREIGRLLRVDHASVLRSIRCGLERLGTLAVGTRAEVRGLEELEERLMAHFNQLEPPEEALRPRPKAPVRAPNPRRPPAERPPLRAMVLRLVRGGETRTAELGEGLRRTEGGRWGSGKLLAALARLAQFYPGGFSVEAFTVDMGTPGMDLSPLADYCREHIPQIKTCAPDATYLMWLDCRALGLDNDALRRFMIEQAGLGLNDGCSFGRSLNGYMRLNAACPRSVLERAMKQLEAAVKAL